MTGNLIMTTAQRQELFANEPLSSAAVLMLDSLPMVSGEPVAWEAPAGIGLMRFVTNEKFKKFSLPVQRNYRPFKCASCTSRPKAKEQHSTEQNFQHFLSYSCTVTDPANRLRMAYFHGANENLSKDIALYTSPQALKEIKDARKQALEDVAEGFIKQKSWTRDYAFAVVQHAAEEGATK